MLGLAPWLEAEGLEGEEAKQQELWRKRAVRCIDRATDPESADFMNFTEGAQPLVDAAFLCHALVRAPRRLAGALPEKVRENLVRALRSTRIITPGGNNWIFFSAISTRDPRYMSPTFLEMWRTMDRSWAINR